MAGVEIRAVRTRADLAAFIDLPWTIYDGDPHWVPPLKPFLRRLLSPTRHPFWASAEGQLFLALRSGQPVGRIGAVADRAYNDFHRTRLANWGFFECLPQPEAAVALFGAAEAWARARGLDSLRGPLNPSLNYEAGLLIQGFESPPVFLMPYNPPYYLELVRACGLAKEKDLLAYHFPADYQPPAWARGILAKIKDQSEVRVRLADPGRFDEEVALIGRIYEECWRDNWGYTPLSAGELALAIKSFMPFMEGDLVFFLCHGSEPIGFCMIVPDVNPLLRRFNGRLGLTALIKKHLYDREVVGLRGLLLGVKPAYRQTWAGAVAMDYVHRTVQAKGRYRYVELGWNLEDNQAINNLYEEGGARPHKRYRLYRKEL